MFTNNKSKCLWFDCGDKREKIFLCTKCLRASYTPVGLMPNHYCPVPTKEEDLWSKVLQNKTIVQKQVRRHEKNNPKAFKTVYECNVCLTSKNATKQLNEKDMKMHFLRKHQNITEINPKTLIRDDFIQLNKLCHRYYKCNICANESAGLNWTKTEPRPKESLEFEEFVKMLSREQKKMKERARQEDSVNEMHDVLVNFDREEAPITEKLELTSLHMSNTSVTQKKYKINKKFFYKSRDALQCHFKTKHMPLVNITDVRVMKYRGAPHECSLCGNQTIREQLDIDHHVDYHLNFTEMFDGGLLQLDYRTKKFNAPYIENFNFSHLFCTRCNQYIDTNKSHEPEPHELLAHKLDHINLHILGYQDYVKRKTVQIENRPLKFVSYSTDLNCQLCNFSSPNTSSIIQHLASNHSLAPHHLLTHIPRSLKPRYACPKCNETFNSHADFIDHVTKVHETYYYCQCCGKTNYYRANHLRHMVKFHNNSTATVLYDDWDKVEKLWTSISEPGESQEPTFGTDVFTVDSEDYTDPTYPHIMLDSPGN
ncbi:hypothetical protein M8J75_012211 [Diaphorina citri]|nr:hypothetical protein M8J75_012211 [Diaphorina citri]